MRILGVDPGTILTGYGIIDFDNKELRYVSAGIIESKLHRLTAEKNPAAKEMPLRLQKIYNELNKLIKQFRPDEFALETAFYGRNAQSALKIGYARGVSMLAAIHNEIPLKEYSPREIKKSVVGSGSSSKEQVQYMIKKLLAIRKTKMKFDESDALAVAICHAFKITSPNRRSKSWKEFIAVNPERVINF
ncbi:MAG: crossover junction endodeoxyribonuclease RuvC [Bacteroidota bacterium]